MNELTKGFKPFRVHFVLYSSVRPDGETWECAHVLALDADAAEAAMFRMVGGESLVYKSYVERAP